AGRRFRDSDRKSFLHLEGFRIEDNHLICVFKVYVHETVGNDRRLAIAFDLHCAHNLTRLRVNRGDVVRAVVVSEDAFSAGIEINAVRSFTDFDFLNELQRRGIEHRNLVLTTVARKPVFELGSKRHTVNAGRVCDGPDQLTVVRIDHVDLRPVRQVQTSSVAIDRYVIKTAVAGNRITCLDFVSGSTLPDCKGNGQPDESSSDIWHKLFLL